MLQKHEIAQALKNARKSSKLKLKEVAEILGVSYRTISGWEHEHSQPDAKSLLQLRRIYGFSSIDEMLECSVDTPFEKTILIDERELITAYRKLNDIGKNITMANAKTLTELMGKLQ